MSLLSEYMETFVYMVKTITPDGYGGYSTQYNAGAAIQAAAVLNTTPQVVVAEKMDIAPSYTITTGREINLQYHDVIKRERDGKVFRVTSDGDDNKTPASTRLNMRNVTAEEWELTS